MTDNTALRAIFDACPWGAKHDGQLPEPLESSRYVWREEEAHVAGLFFSSGILPEETAAVRRSLYLGQDRTGAWALCVVEKTCEDFDVKAMAGKYMDLLEPDKVKSAFARALGKDKA